MNPCLLAIDAGTTSVKVCLFSPALELIGKSVQEYRLQTSENRAEAAAEMYLDAIRKGLLAIDARNAPIAAVGLTAQGETLTVTDRQGCPQRPFLVWLDQRADKEAEELSRLFPIETYYRETGLPGLTGASPLAKALWLRRHEPQLFTTGHKLLLLEDFLLRLMTGRFVTEKTMQTSTGWFSLRGDGWWQAALDAAGIGKDALPQLLGSGAYVGRSTAAAEKCLGLPAGIPVFTGAMDQVSASYAVRCLMPGTSTETTGTALVAGAVLKRLDGLERTGASPTTVYRHVEDGEYMLLPIGNTGGMCLTWFRDRFCPGMAYETLDTLVKNVPPSAEGLLFLPFLDGAVDPDLCPEARAVFFGGTLSMGREHFARAVMEGVAHLLADMLGIMDAWGVPPGPVCSLGGGARSPVWEQIKADICGREFFTLPCEEAAAMGAALLAGRGAGIVGSALPKPRIAARYPPDPRRRALYQAAHERYQQLYRSIRPLFEGGSNHG